MPAIIRPITFKLFAMLSLLLAPLAFGQDSAELQERMRERVPQVDALKRDQLVGENNKGFLEARGRLDSEQQQLVKAENDDRRQAYEAIAEQTGATPEQVGVVRARQLAARSARGVLVQNEQGEWRQK